MQGQGDIKFFIFQNPGPDHFPAAAAALFCRLEDKAHASVPVFPQLPQNPGHSCQIGRVHIVAAGVHNPRVPGTKGQVIFLPHGQRVHIRPQEQVFPRRLSFQVRDQPGASNAGTQGKAHRAEGLPDFSAVLNSRKASSGSRCISRRNFSTSSSYRLERHWICSLSQAFCSCLSSGIFGILPPCLSFSILPGRLLPNLPQAAGCWPAVWPADWIYSSTFRSTTKKGALPLFNRAWWKSSWEKSSPSSSSACRRRARISSYPT